MRRVAVGTAVLMGGKVGGRGLQFVKQLLMARLLGKELLGTYAYLWSFILLFAMFAHLGLPNGVIRFASRYRSVKDGRGAGATIMKGLLAGLLSSTIFTIIILICAPWIAEHVLHDTGLTSYLRLFALGLPFVALLRISVAGTRVSQRMQFGVIADEFVRGVLNLGLFVALFLCGMWLSGAILACILSFAGGTLVALYCLRRLYPGFSFRGLRDQGGARISALMRFSTATMVSAVSGNIINRSDRLLLGYLRTTAEVGVYHAAAQIPFALTMIFNTVGVAMMPVAADLSHQGRIGELGELFRNTTKWRLYVVLPCSIVVFIVPRELLLVVLGDQYVGGVAVLLILTVAQVINAGTGSVGAILLMSGRQKLWLVLTVIMMLINVGLNFMLIPRLGMIGAAITVAVTMTGLYGVALFLLYRETGIKTYDARYWKGIAAGAVAVAAALPVRWFLPGPEWLLVVCVAAVVALAFAGTIMALKLDADDRQFIQALTDRLKRKRK